MLTTPSSNSSKSRMFQNRIQVEKEIIRNEETDHQESVSKGKNDTEIKSVDNIPQARPLTKLSHPIPLKNYATGETRYDTLHASEAADQVRKN